MAKNGICAVFFIYMPVAFVGKSGRNMLFCHFQLRRIRDRSGYRPFWTGRPERTDDNGRETERATETPQPWQKAYPDGYTKDRHQVTYRPPYNGSNQDRHQVTYRPPYNGSNQDRHQVTYRHKKKAGIGSAFRPRSAPHPHDICATTAT